MMLLELLPYIVAMIFLVILTILDIKTFDLENGFIPSALTTAFIIVSFILGGSVGIISGIFAFLIGMLLADLEVYSGVADWKVVVACGLTMNSLVAVLIFGVGITILAVITKWLLKKRIKQIPFIPVIMIAYIGALIYMLV